MTIPKLEISAAHLLAELVSAIVVGLSTEYQGIETDPEKISAIAFLNPPAAAKELRLYLSVASWKVEKHMRYIKEVLRRLPLKQTLISSFKWEWTEDHQQVFESIKTKLGADPILACPDSTKPFVLLVDANEYGLDAILIKNSDLFQPDFKWVGEEFYQGGISEQVFW
ncbi:uncharacterized protein LOC121467668 [Drosophila elegans]|uniref:uncharacterized protein LOC121467668 n=1 Tax=Drosophila elegans TaxID=30023 RepID=UPI001BC845E4|nr:uncharacterized protein LOC121467668 [Drosophila elegans]